MTATGLIDTYSLKVVLHLTQLGHDSYRLGLTGCLLNLWILDSHEHVVFLHIGLVSVTPPPQNGDRKHTFSSPIVNLPVVTLLFSAKECRFWTASLLDTEAANLTLAFVYSCPGCISC